MQKKQFGQVTVCLPFLLEDVNAEILHLAREGVYEAGSEELRATLPYVLTVCQNDALEHLLSGFPQAFFTAINASHISDSPDPNCGRYRDSYQQDWVAPSLEAFSKSELRNSRDWIDIILANLSNISAPLIKDDLVMLKTLMNMALGEPKS